MDEQAQSIEISELEAAEWADEVAAKDADYARR